MSDKPVEYFPNLFCQKCKEHERDQGYSWMIAYVMGILVGIVGGMLLMLIITRNA